MFRTGADFTVRVLAMPLSMMAAPGASVLHERLYGRYKFTGKVEGCCDQQVAVDCIRPQNGKAGRPLTVQVAPEARCDSPPEW